MDLEKFLQDNSNKKVDGKPLFQPGSYDPDSNTPWQKLGNPSPITAIAINNAERQLQCTLPGGYKAFLQTLGPGVWTQLYIPHPSSLYAFDESTGAMDGFITLCFDVDGCGNHIAFNPKTQGANIYFCSHDPMGYARAGSSFDDLVMKLTEFHTANPKRDIAEYYSALTPFTRTKEKPAPKVSKRKKKPWWMFWK